MKTPSNDAREKILELNKLLAVQLSDNQKTMAAELFKSSIDYGKQALNGLFLLNGAAAVAVVYNKDALEKCWVSLISWCIAGVVLSVACSSISYFAQRCYFTAYIKNSRQQMDAFIQKAVDLYFVGSSKIEMPQWKESVPGRILTFITIIIAAASFCCFAYAFPQLRSEFSA